MKVSSKLLVAAGALMICALVAYRETATLCMPVKSEAHGHDHSDAGRNDHNEFAEIACRDGLVSAAYTLIVPSSSIKTAKADSQHAAEGTDHDHGGHAHDAEEGSGVGFIKLSRAQIKAANIVMRPAASGKLSKVISAPGRVILNANAQARVVSKLSGTVASVNKQLGDSITAGDVLATIESREVADAKADYLSAMRAQDLSRSTFEREERLWKQRITAEQDYLTARNAYADAGIRREAALQRLRALGLSEAEAEALSRSNSGAQLRMYELRAPISGQLTARDLVLGQMVGNDREIFNIADTTKMWVEIAIAPSDLAFAQQNQSVRIRSGTQNADAKIIALSPVIDPETRSAKAIAELDNANGAWKAGDYVEAQLSSGGQDADIIVPEAALQTIKGSKVVFVSEAGGFRVRNVATGLSDSENVEIISGLEFGETVAVSNTFTLKAEFGKAEAEHSH